MKKYIIGLVSLLIALPVLAEEPAWESFDRIAAVVNQDQITESNINQKLNKIKKTKKIAAKDEAREKSRILDDLISQALVKQTAASEAIIISDQRIDNQIQSIMTQLDIKTIDEFKKKIEESEKISFEDYREEMRMNMLNEQLMSISVGFTPPTQAEVTDWYNKNRDKLGFEVNIKHILVIPANSSFSAEKDANNKINDIIAQLKKGESFDKLARKYSQDPGSAAKGGDLGWVNIATLDPYFANSVARMSKSGQISDAIKSSFGYHVVVYYGRRMIPIESIESRIYQMLIQQKMGEEFKRWLQMRRKESDIKIFMTDYVDEAGEKVK